MSLPPHDHLSKRTLQTLGAAADPDCIRAGTRDLFANRFSLPLYTETGQKLNVFAKEDRRAQRTVEKKLKYQVQKQQQSFWSSSSSSSIRPSSARQRPSSARSAAAVSSPRSASSRPSSARSAAAATIISSAAPTRITDTLSLLPDLDELTVQEMMVKARERAGEVLSSHSARVLITGADKDILFVPPLPEEDEASRPKKEPRPAVLQKTDHLQGRKGVMMRRSTFSLMELFVFGMVIARWKRPLRNKVLRENQSESLLQAQKIARRKMLQQQARRERSAMSTTSASAVGGKSRSPSESQHQQQQVGFSVNHLNMVAGSDANEDATEQETVETLLALGSGGAGAGVVGDDHDDDIPLSRREQIKHQQLACTVLLDEAAEGYLRATAAKLGTAVKRFDESRMDEEVLASRNTTGVSSASSLPHSCGRVHLAPRRPVPPPPSSSSAAMAKIPAAATTRPVSAATTTVAAAEAYHRVSASAAAAVSAAGRVGSAASSASRPGTARTLVARPMSGVSVLSSSSSSSPRNRPPTVPHKPPLPSAVSLARATSAQIRRREEEMTVRVPKLERLQTVSASSFRVKKDGKEQSGDDDDDNFSREFFKDEQQQQQQQQQQRQSTTKTTTTSRRGSVDERQSKALLGDIFFLREHDLSHPHHHHHHHRQRRRDTKQQTAGGGACEEEVEEFPLPAPNSENFSSYRAELVDADVESRPATAPTKRTAASSRQIVQVFSPTKALLENDNDGDVTFSNKKKKNNNDDDDDDEDKSEQQQNSRPALSRQGSGLLRRRSSSMLYRPQNESNPVTSRSMQSAAAFAGSCPAASMTFISPNSLPTSSVFFAEKDVIATVPPLLPAVGSSSLAWHSAQAQRKAQEKIQNRCIDDDPNNKSKRGKNKAGENNSAAIPTASSRSDDPAKEARELRQFLKTFRVDRYAADERSARAMQALCQDRRRGAGREMKREFIHSAIDVCNPASQFKSPAGALHVILRGSKDYQALLLRKAALSKELHARRVWLAEMVVSLFQVAAYSPRVPRLLLQVVVFAFLPRRFACTARGVEAALCEGREEFELMREQHARLKELESMMMMKDASCAEGIVNSIDHDDDDDDDDDESSSSSGRRSDGGRDSPEPRVAQGTATISSSSPTQKQQQQEDEDGKEKKEFSEASTLWSEVLRCFSVVPATSEETEQEQRELQLQQERVDSPSWTAEQKPQQQSQRKSSVLSSSSSSNNNARSIAPEDCLPILSEKNFRRNLFERIPEMDLLFPDVQLLIRFVSRGFNMTYEELRKMFEEKAVVWQLGHAGRSNMGL